MELSDGFQLPAATQWLLVSDATHFHMYDIDMIEPKGQGLGFTMRLFSRGVFKMDVAASISYHPVTGTVNAFLHGCWSQQQEKVRKLLEELSDLARHPLLLPVILTDMKLDIIEQEEARLWSLLVVIEKRSGQTDAPAVDSNLDLGSAVTGSQREDAGEHRANVEGDFDFPWVTRKVLGVIQLTTSAESHAKALLLSIGEMKRCITAVEDLTEVPRKESICKAGAVLANKLSLLAHRTQVIMNDIQFVEKRAQAQQTAVYNYIAQREARNSGQIARASKRDSSAMKGIAVLTMVFLPGTYIAAFFAMPILDFPDGSRLPSPKDTFWLYWAITLPLTVAVLAVYTIFQVYIEEKHRTEDQEHPASSPSDLALEDPSDEASPTVGRGIWTVRSRWLGRKFNKTASSSKDV